MYDDILSNGFKGMSLSSMTEAQDRFQQLETKCAKLEQEKKDNSNRIDRLLESEEVEMERTNKLEGELEELTKVNEELADLTSEAMVKEMEAKEAKKRAIEVKNVMKKVA